jgi:hypothetical protein
MEIDQQLEQRIHIKFLVKTRQEWSRNLSDIAAGLWGRCLKKEHCFQVDAALLKRPKIPRATKDHGALPLRAAMKTLIECILSCSVTAG